MVPQLERRPPARRHAPSGLRRCLQLSAGAAAVGILVAAYPRPAWAYLDPGTGSMLIQAAVATIAGALLTLKLYWHRLSLRFARSKDDPDAGLTAEAVQKDADA